MGTREYMTLSDIFLVLKKKSSCPLNNFKGNGPKINPYQVMNSHERDYILTNSLLLFLLLFRTVPNNIVTAQQPSSLQI